MGLAAIIYGSAIAMTAFFGRSGSPGGRLGGVGVLPALRVLESIQAASCTVSMHSGHKKSVASNK